MKYKYSRKEWVMEFSKWLGFDEKFAEFDQDEIDERKWLSDLLATKPESPKESKKKCPFCGNTEHENLCVLFGAGGGGKTNGMGSVEKGSFVEILPDIEPLEHIPDPYGKGWCIANKSMKWYAPDKDYDNQIDIIRRTLNECVDRLNTLSKRK